MTTLAKNLGPGDDAVIRDVILRALEEHTRTGEDAALRQLVRLAVDYPTAWQDALVRAVDRPWRAKADATIRGVQAAVRLMAPRATA